MCRRRCVVRRARPQRLARALGRRGLFRRRTAVRDLSERRSARARLHTCATATCGWRTRALGRARFDRRLAASRAASLPLVVGALRAAPLAAEEAVLDRQPHPPVDSFSVDGAKAVVAPAIDVCRAQSVDLVVATRVLQSLRRISVGRTLGRCSACSSDRCSLGAITRSVSATRGGATAATSRCCSRSGIGCSAPPTTAARSNRPACATSLRRRPAADAAMGAASGRGSGWA